MKVEHEKKYLLWLNRHQHALQKYAGRWVGIKLDKGIVASGKSLRKVREAFVKSYPMEVPHLLQVPLKGERFYILIHS